jgi:hypothetical protein
MTRKFLVLSLILILLTACAGQKKIENTLTNEYQNIKGTKVSLIPPKGFIDGINFLGLQQSESSSSIMVSDFPGPYSEVFKALTKEKMLSQGVEVKAIENLTINGFPAIFLTGTQNAHGYIYTKYILMFGIEQETIILSANFPENLKTIGREIKKSILTVFYDKNKKLDPFASIDYSIDVSKTKLKFAKNMSNSLIYTVDGQIPTASTDKTDLIIAKSFYEITQEDKKLFSINRLKQVSTVEVEEIEYVEEITIDGIKGYEIFARAKNKKTKETANVYQVILFSDKLYYILFFFSYDDTDNSINDIKKAILTFKRK